MDEETKRHMDDVRKRLEGFRKSMRKKLEAQGIEWEEPTEEELDDNLEDNMRALRLGYWEG